MIKRRISVLLTAALLAGSLPASFAHAAASSNAVPTSFANLYQNRHGIANAVVEKLHSATSGSGQQLPTIQTFVGPNTKLSDKTTKADLQNLYKYMQSNGFIKNVVTIYYNIKDVNWANNQYTSLLGPQEVAKIRAFKGMTSQPDQQSDSTNSAPQPVTSAGLPCSTPGQTQNISGSNYFCGTDNSATNVWEASCGPVGSTSWHINNVAGTCTDVGNGRSIWEFPAGVLPVTTSPNQSNSSQQPPLISCWSGDPNGCESADAWVALDGTAYLTIGVPKAGDTNDNPNYKSQLVMMYYALWLSYYVENNSLQSQTADEASKNIGQANFPPYWLYNADEFMPFALATYGNSVAALEKFLTNQSSGAADMVKNNNNKIANYFGKTFNLNWINNFLNIKYESTLWRQMDPMSNIGFSLGSRVVETFIAVKGPQVLSDIPNFMSQGLTFDQAFQKEFGTSWQSAEPEIAKTVWDEYQHGY